MLKQNNESLLSLGNDWKRLFQISEKAYRAISVPSDSNKKLGEFQQEDKKLCADLLRTNFNLKNSPKEKQLKFWGEVHSLKDPVAYLSYYFEIQTPIFYENAYHAENTIDFIIKTTNDNILCIEIGSLTNEIIEANTEKIHGFYKVSSNEINNEKKQEITTKLRDHGFKIPKGNNQKSNQITQKIIASLSNIRDSLRNYNEEFYLDTLKTDRNLPYIGLNKETISEMIGKYQSSVAGAKYEIALKIDNFLESILGYNSHERYDFKISDSENQLFQIIDYMIRKKSEIIIKYIKKFSSKNNRQYILILNGNTYNNTIILINIYFVMHNVLCYLNDTCIVHKPFSQIFITGFKDMFWVFSKYEKWQLESYPTISIS